MNFFKFRICTKSNYWAATVAVGLAGLGDSSWMGQLVGVVMVVGWFAIVTDWVYGA